MRESSTRGSREHRRPLIPEEITATALGIADAEGLDAVSIRRVAGEVDARPMSLYIHFDSKDDLLASMANAVMTEVLLDRPMSKNWREAVAAGARKMYATFVRHPWVISVFMTRPHFGPTAAAIAEQNALAVKSLALEAAEIWSFQGTVNDYVLGHSLRASAARTAAQDADLITEEEIAAVPELAALPDFLRSRSSVERFEFGLQIVLDGFEQQVLR